MWKDRIALEHLAAILRKQVEKLDSYITADIKKDSNWIKVLHEKQNKAKAL